ncbi:MAG: galactitol-1-phosphate 5-dehydrogenase [Verrucomicrobiota bacterium]
MKALTLEAYNDFQFGDAPDPECGPDDVIVQIRACGICGSDIHGMDGSSGRRIPPIIMGHEAAGVIDSLGSNVSGWNEGDRVTFDSMIYCEGCDVCDAGQTNLCETRMVIGVSCDDYRRHGCFAEKATIPGRLLMKIPDNVTFEQAAFVEPVSVALHAVNCVPLKEGDTALVVGTGMIGLLVVQALKAKGAKTVYCIDKDEKRLKLAKELGAAECFSADDSAAVEKIRQRTDGLGVDVAMEVVGITPTINAAMDALRLGGSLGAVGNISATVDFPLQKLVTREISVHGSAGSSGECYEALDRIADGSIRVDPLISAAAPLSEGADWFKKLYDGSDLMKVILKPS